MWADPGCSVCAAGGADQGGCPAAAHGRACSVQSPEVAQGEDSCLIAYCSQGAAGPGILCWRLHGTQGVPLTELKIIFIQLRHGYLLPVINVECVLSAHDGQKQVWRGHIVQVKAARKFVEETGRPAGIGALQDAVDIVRGRKGTLVIAQK